MITLQKNVLKAALISAAKKDMRYWLNGILFKVAESGKVYISSTDGHRLFVANIEADWTDGAVNGPLELIIPREAVETAVKAKSEVLTLSALPDGRYTLGDAVFSPVDGKFPNINQVIPRHDMSGEPAHFNCDYLADAQKALRLVSGLSDGTFRLYTNGDNGYAYMGCDPAFIVIMPIRISHSVEARTFLAD